MSWLLRTSVAAVCVVGAHGAYGPAHAQSEAPNPYAAVEGWAKMPAGRPWGSPAGVDIDRDGRSLWVFERCGNDSCADSTLPPILKFDETGALVKSFGAGMFVFPHGLAVDKDGNVWVTDGRGVPGKGHQVFKFSPDGKLLMTLGKPGVAGDGIDTFNMPSDVAIAPNGDIFVADGHTPLTTNHRIVKFSKDGKFLKAFAKKGAGRGELDDPHAIAFDSRGRLLVADRANLRIQIFDQDGNVLDEWKQFGRPSGLYITRDDTLYVADAESGIRIANARDGAISAFIRKPQGVERVAESVAVTGSGIVYAGENGVQDPPRGRLGQKLMKYVRTVSAAALTTPDIPGVVKGGTTVRQVQAWDPSFGGEGPVPSTDGGVLFCLQDQNKIMKIDRNGQMSTFVENTPRTNGLAVDSKGRLIGVGSTPPQILVLAPSRTTIVDAFEGQPFLQTADLVIGTRDDIYFTDPTPRAVRREGADLPPGRKAAVFHRKPNGETLRLTEDVARPNGIQLSPDEKVLYVAGPEWVVAYDIQSDGRVRNPRNFAPVAADGLAVDAAGRVYAAGVGVRVFSRDGKDLGTIPIPIKPANLAFGGAGRKKNLYVVGRGGAYEIAMQAEGPRGRAK